MLGKSGIIIFELSLILTLNNTDLTCWYSNGDVFLRNKHCRIAKFKKVLFVIKWCQSRLEIDFFQTDHSREQFSVLTEWIETRTRGVSLADGLSIVQTKISRDY